MTHGLFGPADVYIVYVGVTKRSFFKMNAKRREYNGVSSVGIYGGATNFRIVRHSRERPQIHEVELVSKLLLSVNEACESLGIGRSHFYELVREGKISTVQIGPRGKRVHIDEIRRFAESGVAGEDDGVRY